MKKNPTHQRILYAVLSAILLLAEILIGLFAHDRFIRPFFGDVLVVILIGCLIRIIWPQKLRWLSLYVFVFACFVEFMQRIGIVEILGLQEHTFLRVLIGTSFDWRDILCYAVGCAAFAAMERIIGAREPGESGAHNRK